MGGFAEGDAVQVDVRASSSSSCSSSLATILSACKPLKDVPRASHVCHVLSNLDFHITDPVPASSQYDPASLQYMLDFFRTVAQSIPDPSSPSASQDGDVVPIEPAASRDESSKRAGIIVLREDLDFYAIPPKADIEQPEMIDVKRAAAKALLKQNGIFSGLKRSDEPGTTEAHLIEMLTAG